MRCPRNSSRKEIRTDNNNCHSKSNKSEAGYKGEAEPGYGRQDPEKDQKVQEESHAKGGTNPGDL